VGFTVKQYFRNAEGEREKKKRERAWGIFFSLEMADEFIHHVGTEI